jgi:hypothetical protein
MDVFVEGNTPGIWKQKAMEAFKMSDSTFNRRLNKIADKVVEKRGERYFSIK